MVADRIDVRGLVELQRELRKVSAELPRMLRVANLEAAELVAAEARARALALGGVAAKVAPSVKALAEQRRAAVRLGGARYPMAMGAEFGGRGRPRTRQFAPWRGNGAGAGYFLHPAKRDKTDEVVERFGDAVERITRAAFPD